MATVPGHYTCLGARDPQARVPLQPLQGDGIVGSMSAHWQEWRKAGAPRLIVQWLRAGVPLAWTKPPEPIRTKSIPQSEEVKKEMKSLIRSGAFQFMDTPFVSPTFTIPKKDGGIRLIHDLKSINAALTPPKFTLRGAQGAASVVRNCNWLVALDLCHGYQQVAMDRKAVKYLGAMYGNKTVVSTVLPFGLSISPYIFTRITNWLAREIRKRFNLHVAVYVDDFLLGGDSKEELPRGIESVKRFFNRLVVVLSPKTSQEPSQKVKFLGFLWDAASKEISVTPSRRKEYRREVKNLLRHPQ